MTDKVIDIETTETSLPTIIDVQVEKIVPAEIVSNISKIKDTIVPLVEKYAKTVVTVDNFKEIKSLCARLNKQATEINNYKKQAKNEAIEAVKVFESDCMEIINTYKNTVDHLKKEISVFEEEEKATKKTEIQKTIDKYLDLAVEKNYFSEEYKARFVFNDKWLLKKTTDKDLMEGINAELNRLVDEYEREKAEIESLKQVIKTQCEAAKIDPFNSSKYVDLLKAGTPLAQIVTYVGKDVENIKNQTEKAVKKAVDESKNEAVSLTSAEVKTDTIKTIVDEKTGEVIANFNENKIEVLNPETNVKFPTDTIYNYTYDFGGNALSLLYLNRFMKVLSKIYPKFKFKRMEKK